MLCSIVQLYVFIYAWPWVTFAPVWFQLTRDEMYELQCDTVCTVLATIIACKTGIKI